MMNSGTDTVYVGVGIRYGFAAWTPALPPP